MRHNICYRDPSGKHECDRKMLAELNTLVPKGRREKVDRQLVRSIGLKHRLGLGNWRANFTNRHEDDLKSVLYLLNKLMIYGLQMSPFS